MLVVDFGHYEELAGLLWGPVSPIYGFGAVLMTLALNRVHNAPIPVVFLDSAVIGGAFEYFVSWFMEYAFGAISTVAPTSCSCACGGPLAWCG